jgi:hypothetical protein
MLIEVTAAVVAEAGPKVIFLTASLAVIGQLARGHREEKSVVAFDQFDVSDDEGVVKRQRAECLEAIILVMAVAEFDPDVSQAHNNSPKKCTFHFP